MTHARLVNAAITKKAPTLYQTPTAEEIKLLQPPISDVFAQQKAVAVQGYPWPATDETLRFYSRLNPIADH